MTDHDLLRMRDQVVKAFEKTLEALLAKPVVATLEGSKATLVPEPDSILWQQIFSILPDPAAWVYAPEATWKTISTEVLTAAGLDEVTEEDQRSTWSEVVQQSLSAFTTVLTSEVQREITLKKGGATEEVPATISKWLALEFELDRGPVRLDIAISPDLVAVYDSETFTETLEKPQKLSREGMSKTFDLLLDVSLPVSVSFGKTSLQLREVLKLNTGSIVELDRFVTEPVDVVVNDCIIARGDVVVVDGNYGVRIRQLASREDRLRTGVGDLAGVTSRKP